MDNNAIKNQATALGRGGVWFAAGVAVGAGYIHGDTAVTIAGALLTVLGGGLTSMAHTNSSVVQAAAQVPEVKQMTIADEKLAEVAKEKAQGETKIVIPKGTTDA